MQCELIEKDIVGFHFGLLDSDRRKPVEDHLCECENCLRAFLTVKGHFEIDFDDSIPKPSTEMKAKLFSEVASLFPRSKSEEVSLPLTPKRVPLLPYRSAIAATAMTILLLVVTNRYFAPVDKETNQSAIPISAEIKDSVDSARRGVENVNFL
jgi:hypothetical protein